MSIFFFNEDVILPDINFEVLQKVIKGQVRKNKFKLGLINYIFCSDEYLLSLNVKFLHHDYFTDVITFDYSTENIVSGDIYISTDRVLNNSAIFEQKFSDELVRVLSHGLLHLLKYNDKEKDEILMMRIKESEMLGMYNFMI